MNDKVYLAMVGVWLAVTIATALAVAVTFLLLSAPPDDQLERAFLAGMGNGNQMCGVITPEAQRRKPLNGSGGLL